MLANIKSLIVVVAFLQIVLALLDETYGPYGYKGEKPYLWFYGKLISYRLLLIVIDNW